MDETELEKRLKELSPPPPSEKAKERTRQQAWFRLRKASASRFSLVRSPRWAASVFLVVGVSFGLLSYSVTQSSRSGGGDAMRETSKISSAQMAQYAAGVRTSMVRMIIGGQEAAHLEFNPPSQFAGCTEDPPGSGQYPRCVFHPTGGGATWVMSPDDFLTAPSTWRFNGANQIYDVGKTAHAAPHQESADLLAFLPNVKQVVCEAINQQLGIEGIPIEAGIVFSEAANMVNLDGHSPTSISASGGTIGGDGAEPLNGKPLGCFEQDGAYVYYHVLIER